MAEQRVIYIVIDPSKARSGASSVVNSMRGIEAATDRVNHRLRNTDRAMQSFSRNFARLQAVLIAAQPVRFLSGFIRELVEADKVVTTFKSQMFTVTGDLEQAGDAFDYLKETAQSYAVPLNSITKGYAKLKASMDFDHLRQYNDALFQSTVILSSVLHMPEHNAERVFNVMIQIMSKGQLMMEELKQQLGEHVPGAIALAAESMGYSVEEMMDRMQKGLISAEEFAAGWSEHIIERFGPAVEIATKSIQASITRFKNIVQQSMIEMSQSEAGFAISQMILSIVGKLEGASEHFKTFGLLVAEVALDIDDFIKSLTPEDIDKFFRAVVQVAKAFLDLMGFIGNTILFLTEYKSEVKLIVGVIIGATVATKSYIAMLDLLAVASTTAAGSTRVLSLALAGIVYTLGLVGSAFAGWSIGSWLYDEYDEVKRAGNLLAMAVHVLVETVSNNFELMGKNIELAFKQPLNYVKIQIADFLMWLSDLGQGVIDFLGIDLQAENISPAHLMASKLKEGTEEVEKQLQDLKDVHQNEIHEIIRTYDDLYKAIGQDDGNIESVNERLGMSADLLEKYRVARDKLQKDALSTAGSGFDKPPEDNGEAKLMESLESMRGDADPAFAEFTRYADQIDMIEKFNVSKEEKDRLREYQFEEHTRRMAEIAKDGSKEIGEIQVSEAEKTLQRLNDIRTLEGANFQETFSHLGTAFDQLSQKQISSITAVGAAFDNIGAIMKEGGEAQFENYKRLAMAQALVSTALAVTNALAVPPPPVGIALATTIGGLGAVQIAAIEQQEYQGSYLGGGYTGDGPRSGGLDGKGGFAAVLHPNETVIDNEMGQSSGSNSTNVTQVFQLSDNARREAKQAILESAPFIRQQAKAAVLEAISQGGAMSRAVGRRS